MILDYWHCPEHGHQTTRMSLRLGEKINKCPKLISNGVVCGRELVDGPKEITSAA